MSGRQSCSILIPTLLWLALVLTGCATVKAPVAEAPAPEAEGQALLAMWLERTEALQSLQGLARVRVKSPHGSMSGTQVVLAARPDRLRAETLSPFGTSVLSLAADGRRLTVQLPGDNLTYSGAATPENLARFTRMPLSPTALVDILLWQPPLVAFEELSTFRIAGGGWRLLLVAGPLRQELTFDAAVRLAQVRYFSGDVLQLSVGYSGFAEAAVLPRQIDLEQPPFSLQASLDFSELTVNEPLPDGRFALQPLPGSRILSLDQPGSDPEPAQAPGLWFEGRQ